MTESERSVSVDDEDLEALLDNKDSKNTKTCIKSAVNILTAFCASKKGCEMGRSVDKLINPVRRDTSCIDDDSHVENTSGTKINI